MRATEHARGLRARVTVRLHAVLNALDRRAATHALGRAATRGLVQAALRAIAREPAVRSVYARGSHGRGDFVPLASDLDLAVVLREPAGRPEFAATLGVVQALDRTRRWNPLLRDAWQMIVGDTEWPLVERHANHFQLDEWRDRDGRAPGFSRFPVDERLALAALWNRLHLWTDSALRHVLAPVAPSASGGLAFAAAEKKCLALAARLTGGPPPRRRQAPPGSEDEALCRAAMLLDRLETVASVVAAQTAIEPAAALPEDRSARDETERALVATIRRTCRMSPVPLARIILHSGLVAVVTQDAEMSPEHRLALVGDLVRTARETGRRCFVYSPLAFALAPIYEPMQVLRLEPGAGRPQVTPPPEPLLLHEQLLYEALFTGTELRGAACRPLDHPGLEHFTQRLARLLVYFESGALVRDRAEALARLATLRPGLRRRLDESADRAERFAADAALFEALVEHLGRSLKS